LLRRRRVRFGILAVALLVLLAAGAVLADRTLLASRCGGYIRLSVTTDSHLAPVVRTAAQRWQAGNPQVNAECVRISVTAADPADVAAAIASRTGASLSGVGRAAGTVAVPQVWIPDSTMWLTRLRAANATKVPATGTSVATSPVVLAVPDPVLPSLGLTGSVSWKELVGKLTSGTHLNAGLVDPSLDAAALSGLLSLGSAAGTGDAGQEATVATLRRLATQRSTVLADLLGRFPRATDASSLTSGLTVGLMPEWALIGYDRTKPAVAVDAVYPTPSSVPLDYPYAELSGLSSAQRSAAEQFRAYLGGVECDGLRSSVGLRNQLGVAGTGFATGHGLATQPTGIGDQPGADALDTALSTWTAITQPGRMLAVLDISGSMSEAVPTAGGASREAVAVGAAQRGLGLFDDAWEVGLWTFSTQLSGNTDYRQLVPICPLSSCRGQITSALGTVTPKPNGETGLYDTVLAAYQTVQQDWDASRNNTVVILTDGQNEDPVGISLTQLVSTLQRIRDPQRPVEVIAIGIGDQVSQAELTKITQATGGGVFLAPDPAQVGAIFLKAIALRVNTPH
jgi:Ca-activated chloride channel homolog